MRSDLNREPPMKVLQQSRLLVRDDSPEGSTIDSCFACFAPSLIGKPPDSYSAGTDQETCGCRKSREVACTGAAGLYWELKSAYDRWGLGFQDCLLCASECWLQLQLADWDACKLKY